LPEGIGLSKSEHDISAERSVQDTLVLYNINISQGRPSTATIRYRCCFLFVQL